MSLFDAIGNSIKNHFDKKKEDEEWMNNLRKEAEGHQRLAFEEEFKKNAKLVAISKAKKEASEKSGLQKLRATNRLRRLNENTSPQGSFFEKLGDHCKTNIANREANLKRTEEMRNTAKQMKENKVPKKITSIPQRTGLANRRSTWKN